MLKRYNRAIGLKIVNAQHFNKGTSDLPFSDAWHTIVLFTTVGAMNTACTFLCSYSTLVTFLEGSCYSKKN